MDAEQPHIEQFEQLEAIRRYLAGEMTPEEAQAFAARLAAEPDLQAALDLEVAADRAVRAVDAAQTRRQLQDMHVQMLRTQRFRRLRRRLAVAASILLVLAPISYLLLLRPSSEVRLFRKHFSPYPDLITMKDDGDSSRILLALQPYGADVPKYEKAIELFAAVPADDPFKMEAHLYAGVSHLALDQPEPAIAELKLVIAGPKARLVKDAKWYLGLAYLRANQLDLAEKTFQEIAPTFPKARSILDALPAANPPPN